MNTVYHIRSEPQPGTIYDGKENRLFPALVRRRDNDFYRRGMAIRYACQLREEGINLYDYVNPGKWRAYREKLRRRNLRYKYFPQNSDDIVVSDLGMIRLPDDFSTRTELIDRWIANIPNDRRVGGTREFGGKHSGSRPRSKEPGRYLRLNAPIERIVEKLKSDKIAHYRDGIGNVRITGMGEEETAAYLLTI